MKELLQSALDRPASERSDFLAEACAADDALRAEVESLLEAHVEAGEFLEHSPSAPASLIGTTVGSYRILGILGSGGMGEVYLAVDTRLGRHVALKFLSSQFTSNAERVRRFRQEAEVASGLNHPNILTIHELGEHQGVQFIASELVEGETLRARLERGPMQLSEIIRVASQIASALRTAHGAGVVHRDIKPENVMLRPDGYVKVLDFGLAKLSEPSSPLADETNRLHTAAGVVMGTPQYMSPEQVRGQLVDARTDQWSLGVVLYEMVSGRRPFEGPTGSDVIVAILGKEHPPVEAPEELRRITARLLRKNREERYPTADDLCADLASFQKQNDTGPASHEIVDSPGRSESLPIRRLTPVHRVAVGLLLGALLIASIIYLSARSSRRRAPNPVPATPRTVAVLPFRPLSSGPIDEYLALGMADAVITRLAQIQSVIVRPTSSVLKYAGSSVDPVAAGRELAVESILDGRFQRIGNRIRVSVQLIHVRDRSSIWAQSFDAPYNDVLTVQDAISERVAAALAENLSRRDRERLTRRYTENIEAYHLYLRGRYFWERRTTESLRKSIDYYQQAIANDPAYALAYAGLADSYNILGNFSVLPPGDAYPKANAAAARALEIDPGLAQAEIARAFATYLYDRDWETAERGFKRALAGAPNYAPGHQWYAVCLVSRGRSNEAVAAIRRALEIDPLSLVINAVTGWIYYLSRDYEPAIDAAKQTVEMDATFPLAHTYLGMTFAAQGRYPEAEAEMRKGIAGRGEGVDRDVGLLGLVLARAGRPAEALEILRELQQRARVEYVSPYGEALVRLGLGQKTEALTLLERAAEEHYPWAIHYNVEPALDSLREEPRFKALLRRIGIPEMKSSAGSRLRAALTGL